MLSLILAGIFDSANVISQMDIKTDMQEFYNKYNELYD